MIDTDAVRRDYGPPRDLRGLLRLYHESRERLVTATSEGDALEVASACSGLLVCRIRLGLTALRALGAVERDAMEGRLEDVDKYNVAELETLHRWIEHRWPPDAGDLDALFDQLNSENGNGPFAALPEDPECGWMRPRP